ncbi:MAG TPA: hypothetical protein PLW13_14350, partial [Pseudomonadales bacterium]|nr:hypothetical protein [Pseudomonadales bacterium]
TAWPAPPAEEIASIRAESMLRAPREPGLLQKGEGGARCAGDSEKRSAAGRSRRGAHRVITCRYRGMPS